ncbi:hypothetical protein B0I37DRAFT_117544 [Chaetomium sp. MPI-CAGE-AT-0009]|nr:hypothetical protein B0I37DRAFT_117544 [Chaetomium sp. MPI-CAGE-AT-0009]
MKMKPLNPNPTPPPEPQHHNDDSSSPATAPLLPSDTISRDRERIDAIAAQAASLAQKRVIRQLAVCALLLIPEAVAVGLVASALRDWRRVEVLPDEARASVIVMMVSIVVEALWIALWLPLILCCCVPRRHRMLAVTVGFLGVAAAGVSVYMLAVLGPHLGSGTCDADEYRDPCYRGLTKGVAAGCVRVLVTTPLCIALAVVGFMAGRSRPPPKGPSPWMRLVYGVGALMLPAPS